MCPSHREFEFNWWTASYGYNWQYLFSPGPDYPHSQWQGFKNDGLRIHAVKKPTTTMSFIDHHPADGLTDLWSYVQRPRDREHINGFGRPHFRHSDTANVLYCDGHASNVDPSFADPDNEEDGWKPM